MKEDTAGRIHRDQYGRSDKVNAPENQNREFQNGYRAGVETLGLDAVKMINEEGHLREEVGDDLGEKWPNGCVDSGLRAVRWQRLESKSAKDAD